MQPRDPSPYEPIPGTTPNPRALFIDRWGTLLVAPERGHAQSFQEVEFTPGAVDALFRACQAGWRVYLIGNEDAVAHGHVRLEAWRAMEAALQAHLAEHGARIDRSYVCLDDPEHGVKGQRRDSVYRLPNTGAFYHALHNDRVELRKSWVIGDSSLELVAGWRAGVRQAGVRTGQAVADGRYDVTPDLLASDLTSALLELLELENALHP